MRSQRRSTNSLPANDVDLFLMGKPEVAKGISKLEAGHAARQYRSHAGSRALRSRGHRTKEMGHVLSVKY